MQTIIAYLKLIRPANILTAIADIMAGFAISGAVIQLIDQGNGWFYVPEAWKLGWLVLSTIGLYGGGVVFNDVFDAELDKKERPERPIPSGAASVRGASLLGAALLIMGILAAWQVSFGSMMVAAVVAFWALFYDAIGKLTFFGPINMGLCRGGNLLLGISAVPASTLDFWFIGLIPVVYITAVTMVSKGEVHGSNVRSLKGAMVMYLVIVIAILGLSLHAPKPVWMAVPFVVAFAGMIFPPLLKAIRFRQPQFIGKAVKAGVIALILMDAAMAVGFAGWLYGLLIVLLLPLSMWVAKGFAVT